MLDEDAACSHFDDGCTAVQVGDVNARRRLSLAVLVCDNHVHGNLEQALGLVTAAWTGQLAEFEQVAAARRAKSSGENPLQRGAKRDIASGKIVLL